MGLTTFITGGIHPPEHKDLASTSPIETIKLPKRVVVPLSQHIGAPCKALVEPGTRVRTGERIGNPEAFVSAPVHATITGKVTEIRPYPAPNGRMVSCVVIESDGPEEWVEREDDSGCLDKTAEVLKERIKNAGIVGMGGATFPTVVKLSPPKEKPIDTVIINGAECEPYLTADHRVMVESPAEVVAGLKILMKILGVPKGCVGIENNKPDAVKAMKEAAAGSSAIEVIPLQVKYPQGAEKMLIKAITDREVPAGGLPMDVGVVVQNVGTAYAIYDACRYGTPLIERVVSVTGNGVERPRNLRVRIGTPLSRLIEECGGMKKGAAKVISGGPMMGFALYTLDMPVIKGTSGIVALVENEMAHTDTYRPCIRCGRCIRACPMGLMPLMLSVYSEKAMYEDCKEYNLFDCFECGCCTFVCPAKRPIVQQIRLAKSLTKP